MSEWVGQTISYISTVPPKPHGGCASCGRCVCCGEKVVKPLPQAQPPTVTWTDRSGDINGYKATYV